MFKTITPPRGAGGKRIMKLVNQLLRGVVIGIANIIPGVSGGTMMVSMGIYDTLIGCITHLFSDFRRSVKTLLPYLVGMLIGIFALASVLTYCFAFYPLPTSTAFIGLILGGLSPLIRKIDRKRLNTLAVVIFLAFFALIIGMALINPAGNDGRIVPSVGEAAILVAMGIIASGTMLVPGVSGSMVLMLMGYYRPVLASLNDFRDGLLGGGLALAGRQLLILVPFGVGVLLGIYFVAHLIEFLLRRWPMYTYCAVLGLVVASPVAILLGTDLSGFSVVLLLVSIATFAVGFVLSAWLAKGAPAEKAPGAEADETGAAEPKV
jgi:putative membrane protein